MHGCHCSRLGWQTLAGPGFMFKMGVGGTEDSKEEDWRVDCSDDEKVRSRRTLFRALAVRDE